VYDVSPDTNGFTHRNTFTAHGSGAVYDVDAAVHAPIPEGVTRDELPTANAITITSPVAAPVGTVTVVLVRDPYAVVDAERSAIAIPAPYCSAAVQPATTGCVTAPHVHAASCLIPTIR